MAGHTSNIVSVIDTKANMVIDSITGFQDPTGVGYNSATGNIYVGNQGSNYVSIISGSINNVIGTVTVGQAQLLLSHYSMDVVPPFQQPISAHWRSYTYYRCWTFSPEEPLVIAFISDRQLRLDGLYVGQDELKELTPNDGHIMRRVESSDIFGPVLTVALMVISGWGKRNKSNRW